MSEGKVSVGRVDSSEIAWSPEFYWSGGVSLPFLWTKTMAAIPAVLVVGGGGGGVTVVVLKIHPEDLCSEYIHICCADSSRPIFLLGC